MGLACAAVGCVNLAAVGVGATPSSAVSPAISSAAVVGGDDSRVGVDVVVGDSTNSAGFSVGFATVGRWGVSSF
jgi:hypothetical protein